MEYTGQLRVCILAVYQFTQVNKPSTHVGPLSMNEILEKLIHVVQTVLDQQGGLIDEKSNSYFNLSTTLDEARVALAKDQVVADHYIAKLKEAERVWEEQEAHTTKMYNKLKVQSETYHDMWYEEAKKSAAAQEEVKRLKQRFGVTE